MPRMQPSDEQQEIINQLSLGKNVKVDAVPGSGKTTTIIFIMKHFVRNILCMTFSRMLKDETDSKKPSKCRNTTCQTIDGASYYFYGCNKNEIENSQLQRPINYDIIIIDECQDLGFEHFELIKKILNGNQNRNYRIVILGDVKQNIFSRFQKVISDERFLMYGDRIFMNENEWVNCNLSTSYRLTQEIANFIDAAVLNLNKEKIITTKNGNKPRYILSDDIISDTMNEINYYLSLGYNYSDIFIISGTVKKYVKINVLKTILSERGILLYCSTDEQKYSVKLLKDKLVFLTLHGSKGLERKIVILLSFDGGFYECFPDESSQKCPNLLYVGMSRAKEHLSLIHDTSLTRLPFLNIKRVKRYGEIINGAYEKLNTCEIFSFPSGRSRKTCVTEILKQLKSSFVREVISTLDIEIINQKNELIDIPDIIHIEETDTYENVSDISAVAIISLYEFRTTGRISIDFSFGNIDITPDQLIQKSINFLSKEGEFYRRNQIKRRDWINPEKLEQCLRRIEEKDIFLQKGSQFEVSFREFHRNMMISGKADYINYNKRIIVEFKCKTNIVEEDIIQVLFYKFLLGLDYDMYLYNVLTDHLLKINCSNINKTINDIIDNMENKIILSDNEFLEKCLS